jgi:hypothetical protein
MNRSQFLFYATAVDLSPLLSALEADKRLEYSLAGLFEPGKPESYLSYVDIPNFGQASHPSARGNACYLVYPQGTPLRVREVPQLAGGTLFAIDQQINRDTVAFWPGGCHRSDMLLYGEVSTIWDSGVSKCLYELMAKIFCEQFTPVREFLVGPEALDLCRAGVRLTLSASTPPEFDLKPQFDLKL